jgi:hypothetical protein
MTIETKYPRAKNISSVKFWSRPPKFLAITLYRCIGKTFLSPPAEPGVYPSELKTHLLTLYQGDQLIVSGKL